MAAPFQKYRAIRHNVNRSKFGLPRATKIKNQDAPRTKVERKDLKVSLIEGAARSWCLYRISTATMQTKAIIMRIK
jgi:hypothetical protein